MLSVLDGHEPAIADLDFHDAVRQAFRLAAVFGTETPAAEDEHHRMRPLQFRRACGVSPSGRKVRSRETLPGRCQIACTVLNTKMIPRPLTMQPALSGLVSPLIPPVGTMVLWRF